MPTQYEKNIHIFPTTFDAPYNRQFVRFKETLRLADKTYEKKIPRAPLFRFYPVRENLTISDRIYLRGSEWFMRAVASQRNRREISLSTKFLLAAEASRVSCNISRRKVHRSSRFRPFSTYPGKYACKRLASLLAEFAQILRLETSCMRFEGNVDRTIRLDRVRSFVSPFL